MLVISNLLTFIKCGFELQKYEYFLFKQVPKRHKICLKRYNCIITHSVSENQNAGTLLRGFYVGSICLLCTISKTAEKQHIPKTDI